MLDGDLIWYNTLKEYTCYPSWAHNRFFVTGCRYMLLVSGDHV
jgi:hypothetical protein